MKDSERIDQLEKRLNFMTQTLIQVQVDLQQLKESIHGKTVIGTPPAAVDEMIATEVQEPKEIVPEPVLAAEPVVTPAVTSPIQPDAFRMFSNVSNNIVFLFS